MDTSNSDLSLSRGGGNATAAGVSFQAGVAAFFGAALLGEKAIDLFSDLGRIVPLSIRVETEAPVDDILIETTAGGFIFIQAKTSVVLASNLASPLGKTIEQFVRQWMVCASGSGGRRWDRSLSRETDRLVLAVGPGSSDTVTQDLALALQSRRANGSAPLPSKQRNAFEKFNDLLGLAWQKFSGALPNQIDLAKLTSLVDVLVFDFSGTARALVIESMRDIVQTDRDATASFAVLQETFIRLMSNRLGVDAIGLRNRVSVSLRINEPPSYRADVIQLLAYSDQTRCQLEHFEETKIGEIKIRIERKCTQSVLAAVRESILLVGDPGAGKSAVISAAAARLRSEGKEVIELAVDRLPVESAEGLQQQLGLDHPVIDVLDNWPGNEQAFLFIDALDATRGGRSERIFRWLISEVLNMPRKRWCVVASIRSFDLRMGQQFAELFAGKPPESKYADMAFSSVKHVHIPIWESSELEQLLSYAEPIANAIHSGGDRLYDLARIPFNTRLLADLLSGDLPPDAFSKVITQSQLLDLYWSYRVKKHGLAAEVCLRQVVMQMVENRSLQTDRLSIAANNAKALENLLCENVLMPVWGERYISFRHHILFDFAASKVYLNLLEPLYLEREFSSDQSLGLMLGPALIFALNDLWLHSNAHRDEFWRTILFFFGRPDIDPIVRSITGRVASELITNREDVNGLLLLLHGTIEEKTQAKTALTHIIGSLSVSAEDNADIAVEPWCYFASELGRIVEQVGWLLRGLLFLLIERAQTPDQQEQIGSASRNLLSYALNKEEHLVSAAIGFVGDTYGSDPVASRQLLGSLFLHSRFESHGDEDIPWLTRKLDSILKVDPEFVVEIYEKTFARGIEDNRETSIGHSRILPLTSNRRQDFDMSYWNLKEFFSQFLNTNPSQGTKAYIKVVYGYILREHLPPVTQLKRTINVSGKTCLLQEDWSYIWASNPNTQHGDTAVQIVQQFCSWLYDATPEEVIVATETIISENEMAIVWARLFMVAAKRSDILGPILWAIATSYPFLLASDTRKDSIDFIAATYPCLPIEECISFEVKILAYDFSEADDPERVREYILKLLFITIGKDRLRTKEAKAFASITDPVSTHGFLNDRQNFEGTSAVVDDNWWLQQQGVDTEALENTKLLKLTDALKNELQEQNRTQFFSSARESVAKLTGVIRDVDASSKTHPVVKFQAMGVAADILQLIVSMFNSELTNNVLLTDILIKVIVRFAHHPSPEVDPNTEKSFEKSASWGSPALRVSAANAAMLLASMGEAVAHDLRATIEQLLKDQHPAVRMAIASRINLLWFSDRIFMWQLANRIVNEENNGSVLSFFANGVLVRLVHSEPERVEDLIIKLSENSFGQEARTNLRMQIGTLIAILWISHQRQPAKTIIEKWLNNVVESYAELDHVIATLRGAVILGYDSKKDNEIQIRHRSIELAKWVSDVLASNLEVFLANPSDGTLEQTVAMESSKLLNHLLNQFYFSSGAFRSGGSNNDEDRGLISLEIKREFLKEITPILQRMTDVGGPKTIYHLIDLLDFLMETDPEAVFELVARALLCAGQKQGYQFESLGSDQVVKLIGRFLADHRSIFDNELRRLTLVKCLNVFIDVGWPSARRLLHRLPELLQ